VTQAKKIPAKTTRLFQSASLHSTGNISVEVSENKNKAGHISTRGTVSKLFVIFPAESTAAHSLHIQHLYVD
jgi:hypothetical protein